MSSGGNRFNFGTSHSHGRPPSYSCRKPLAQHKAPLYGQYGVRHAKLFQSQQHAALGNVTARYRVLDTSESSLRVILRSREWPYPSTVTKDNLRGTSQMPAIWLKEDDYYLFDISVKPFQISTRKLNLEIDNMRFNTPLAPHPLPLTPGSSRCELHQMTMQLIMIHEDPHQSMAGARVTSTGTAWPRRFSMYSREGTKYLLEDPDNKGRTQADAFGMTNFGWACKSARDWTETLQAVKLVAEVELNPQGCPFSLETRRITLEIVIDGNLFLDTNHPNCFSTPMRPGEPAVWHLSVSADGILKISLQLHKETSEKSMYGDLLPKGLGH